VIAVRAGAGRTVSGRPASELTFVGVMGEDGCCWDGMGVVDVHGNGGEGGELGFRYAP
jgi:hypothetical protein